MFVIKYAVIALHMALVFALDRLRPHLQHHPLHLYVVQTNSEHVPAGPLITQARRTTTARWTL